MCPIKYQWAGRVRKGIQHAQGRINIVGIMRNDVGTCFDSDLLDVFLQEIVLPNTPDLTAATEV